MRRKIIIVFAVLFILVLGVSNCSAGATDYPTRDITYIVPYNPGGSTDPISRKFATCLEKTLPGTVNVVNKPGGSATIGIGSVVRSNPDGYTIGFGTNGALAYQPQVTPGLAWKTPDDYQSIVKLIDMPVILVVRADAPWKTFEEFIADVRKNPGKIRVSNSGFGAMGDMCIKQLNKAAGIKMTSVGLSTGGGEAMIALLGGRVEACASYTPNTMSFYKAGKVKVLGVFKKGKYDSFPEATPIGDSYDATLTAMFSVIAPKGMPKDVLDKLVNASMQAVKTPEFIAFTKSNGYVPEAKGPDGVKKELEDYMVVMAELIKDDVKK